MTTTPFILAEVSDDTALMDRIAALRIQAWRTFIPIESKITSWADPFDHLARHWVILDGDVLAASGRLSIHQRLEDVPDSEVYRGMFNSPPPSPIATISRLVVHPRYRGRALSTWLDQTRIAAAELAGCRCVLGHTHAGDKRIDQLKSQGFRVLGTAHPNEQGILKNLVGVVVYREFPVPPRDLHER
jgi:GNAT superfamily N-acetyltransferase